jgi:hypothetical protein
MAAFNVYKGRKLIDTVFSSDSDTVADVKLSLVNHDGYDADIRVTKPRGPATTELQYIVQGNYGPHGWEDLTASTNYKEAQADLKAYRVNDKAPTRLIKRRVKIGK